MADYEEELQETIRSGQRVQDPSIPKNIVTASSLLTWLNLTHI
jgi:hypothetical protein